MTVTRNDCAFIGQKLQAGLSLGSEDICLDLLVGLAEEYFCFQFHFWKQDEHKPRQIFTNTVGITIRPTFHHFDQSVCLKRLSLNVNSVFLCIKSTSLKIRGRYILMANCCSGVSVRVTPSQILHCVWSVTRFTDRVLCPSCQATCHYSAALALISSLPSLKENYHSSQSPPLCLPLCAPLHIIRCSHACAWQPCFPVPADCCTITHWKLAGQERSAANYAPVIPSQRSHFFSFLSFQC